MPDRAIAIHLIENHKRIRAVDFAADLYESGFWVIADDVAEELKGGDIYFHAKQNAPSFFGGKILDFHRTTDGEFPGRVVFHLRADLGHKGVSAGPEGWGREKKIVRLQSVL